MFRQLIPQPNYFVSEHALRVDTCMKESVGCATSPHRAMQLTHPTLSSGKSGHTRHSRCTRSLCSKPHIRSLFRVAHGAVARLDPLDAGRLVVSFVRGSHSSLLSSAPTKICTRLNTGDRKCTPSTIEVLLATAYNGQQKYVGRIL